MKIRDAIVSAVITVAVGVLGTAAFSHWINAPEIGVILSVAVMGAFIIAFNGEK